jgi:hypothetical protein
MSKMRKNKKVKENKKSIQSFAVKDFERIRKYRKIKENR